MQFLQLCKVPKKSTMSSVEVCFGVYELYLLFYDIHSQNINLEGSAKLSVYNRCQNLHMMWGQSLGPKWPWSWPLVKMATKAHVLHFECITEMFLKINLAGQDLSCHVTGMSNMQNSVHKKADKTSLVWQVDFSRGFMQRLFLYTSDLN